jgi:lysozyme
VPEGARRAAGRRSFVRFLVSLVLIGGGGRTAATVLAPTAVAASYTCPVENRTTRPNNGGAAIGSFAVGGVDLSHWDPPISFTALKAAGQRFAYFKATQGTYMTDWTYAAKSASARLAGLRVGGYHFFDWRLSGVSQARYFVAAVKARGGFHGRLRPMVDVECYAPLGKPVPSDAVPRLRAFVNEVRRLVGVKPIIYTSIFEWQTVTGSNATFGDCRLWSAEWATTAPLKFPPGWTSWTFWQYGTTYRLGDVTMDGDVFNGSATRLAGLVIP